MEDIQLNSKIRIKAMDLLAQREFAIKELRERLIKRFPECAGPVEECLETLIKEGLLSERRFVESFINGRIRKGQGSVKICMELKLRGVAEALVIEVLDALDVNWVELAQAVKVKKFGTAPVADYQQRAKMGRFLQYRGFSHDEINACLEGYYD